MNKIIIIGNLGKDAEVRKSSNGTNYLTFAIADNEIVKGERKTYWYNVTAFTFNEKLVQYYKKGSSLMVTGTVVSDVDLGKDGVSRCRRDVTAVSIDFVGGGKQDSEKEHTTTTFDNNEVNMYSSLETHQKPKKETNVDNQTNNNFFGKDDGDDDLPF